MELNLRVQDWRGVVRQLFLVLEIGLEQAGLLIAQSEVVSSDLGVNLGLLIDLLVDGVDDLCVLAGRVLLLYHVLVLHILNILLGERPGRDY